MRQILIEVCSKFSVSFPADEYSRCLCTSKGEAGQVQEEAHCAKCGIKDGCVQSVFYVPSLILLTEASFISAPALLTERPQDEKKDMQVS